VELLNRGDLAERDGWWYCEGVAKDEVEELPGDMCRGVVIPTRPGCWETDRNYQHCRPTALFKGLIYLLQLMHKGRCLSAYRCLGGQLLLLPIALSDHMGRRRWNPLNDHLTGVKSNTQLWQIPLKPSLLSPVWNIFIITWSLRTSRNASRCGWGCDRRTRSNSWVNSLGGTALF